MAATDVGIFPDQTTIWIQSAGTNGSSLAVGDKVFGEITNFKTSGLEQGREVVNVFGGQINKRTPRTIGEVSFDVTASALYASTFSRWDLMKYGTGKSTDIPAGKCVFLQHDVNSLSDTLGINNAYVTVGDTELAADDMLKKTITLKFTSVTPMGSPNLLTSTLTASNAFFNWTTP
jgi:hypothetical protein